MDLDSQGRGDGPPRTENQKIWTGQNSLTKSTMGPPLPHAF